MDEGKLGNRRYTNNTKTQMVIDANGASLPAPKQHQHMLWMPSDACWLPALWPWLGCFDLIMGNG